MIGDGMRGLLKPLYNRFVRPHLPRKIAAYNGVPVRDVRLLDETDVLPEYEEALLEGIRTHVAEGDRVTVVGGGLGVSSVVAARRTGESGAVVAYEGAPDRVELAQETIELSRVESIASVRHAIVGKNVDVYGDDGGAQVVPADEIDDCDVLVLDCEGAELEILTAELDARTIVVETHGNLGAPEDTVRELLEESGYRVVGKGIENEAKGIVILAATRR